MKLMIPRRLRITVLEIAPHAVLASVSAVFTGFFDYEFVSSQGMD
jgi:hypothetical protein